ncbi:hypothetical protein HDE_07830 [Halotydeus destructor]|nr:hypothetical protein HDE_07830 [Halotydeus destructor]
MLSMAFSVVNSTTIKQRFSKDVYQYPCRVILTDYSFLRTRNRNQDAIGQRFYELSSAPVRGLNCSESYKNILNSGIYDENGNYSGLLGILQRDEADYAFQLVRTDAIVDDNIYVGPAIYSGSASIVSKTARYRILDIEVTDVVRQFHAVTWAYLGIIAFTIMAACSLMYLALTKNELTRLQTAEVWKKPAWTFWEILISQVNFKYDYGCTSATRLVAAIGVFVVISSYLLNFMSCDQVTKQPLPLIDSLEAQLSHRFRSVVPTSYTNFFLYQKLLKSEPGTQLYDLDQLIREKGTYLDAEAYSKTPEKIQALVLGLLDDIDRGNRTIISETVFWDLISIQMLCALDSTKLIDVTVSEPLNEGVLTFFFNKRLPADVIRYLDYHARNSVEFSVTVQRVISAGNYLIEKYFVDDLDTMRCYKRLKDAELDNLEFFNARIKTYKDTIIYCAWTLATSFVVLVAEILGRNLVESRRQPKFERKYHHFVRYPAEIQCHANILKAAPRWQHGQNANRRRVPSDVKHLA